MLSLQQLHWLFFYYRITSYNVCYTKLLRIVHSEMHQAINLIIKSLIKSRLLAKEEEGKFKEKLRQLAFKDQAFVEYSSIRTINRYPHNHPLRKHESVTKDIENILCDFITNENSEFRNNFV